MQYFLSSKVDFLFLEEDSLQKFGEKQEERRIGVQVEKNNIKAGEEIREKIAKSENVVILADSDRCCVDWVAVLHSNVEYLLKASFACPLLGFYKSKNVLSEVSIGCVIPSRKYFLCTSPFFFSSHLQDTIHTHSFYLAVDSSYLSVQGTVQTQLSMYLNKEVHIWMYNETPKENSIIFVLSENLGFTEYFKDNFLSISVSLEDLSHPDSFSLIFSEHLVEKKKLEKTQRIIQKISLAEKIKHASTFGVVFTSADHMDMIGLVSKYLDMHHKKFYHFFLNGLKPQKLGNFIGVDVFVVIQCPFSSFKFEENIVAVKPSDLLLAFKSSWSGEYSTNINTAKKDLLSEISSHIEENAQKNEILPLRIKNNCNLLKIEKGEICTEEQAKIYFQTGEYLKTLSSITVPEKSLEENNELHKGYSGIPTKYTK